MARAGATISKRSGTVNKHIPPYKETKDYTKYLKRGQIERAKQNISEAEVYANFRRNLEKNNFNGHIPDAFKDLVRLEIEIADKSVRNPDWKIDEELVALKRQLREKLDKTRRPSRLASHPHSHEGNRG